MRQISNLIARRSTLITKTGFKGYDVCLNPYVGCQFGCKYCYVRFFIKDDQEEWGDFVRRREHIKDKLLKELDKGFVRIKTGNIKDQATGKKKSITKDILNHQVRMVIGTMTDPYMPIERKYRLTRIALNILVHSGYDKIGIFTRSPIVLDDLDLIKKLPRARVHFSITPYKHDIIKKIEPISVITSRRFDTIKKIKEAGVRVHVNVAPSIPIYSDGLEDEYCQKLAEVGVDEFFIDPMQAYSQSFTATKEALQEDENWEEVEGIMQNKERYLEWKEDYRKRWQAAWARHGSEGTLPIWCDHINHVWQNLTTEEHLNPRCYND